MAEKLPAYQWYPGDWRKHAGVQSLTYEERGVWRECLDFMHTSTHRGRLVYPNGFPIDDEGIARMLGIDAARWKQIRSKLTTTGVANEGEDGALESRRMLRDERTRKARARAGSKGGLAGRKGGRPSNGAAKPEQPAEQNNPPSSSSSSSSSPSVTTEPHVPEEPPQARSPLAGKRELSGDWAPTDSHRAKAEVLNLALAEEAENFRHHHRAHGTRFKDWDAAFHTWLRNSRRFKDRDHSNGNGGAAHGNRGTRNGRPQAEGRRPESPSRLGVGQGDFVLEG